MADKIINNVPDFDPAALGKQGGGFLRSWKLWALVGFIVGFFISLMLLQNLFSGFTLHRAKAAPQVETSTQTPPDYRIEQPKVVLATVPVQQPDPVEVPTPAPEAPQPPDPAPQPSLVRPVQPQGRPQPKKLPTVMSWTISAELPKQEGFVDGRVPMRARGCTLKPGGSLIPVTLNSATESEIPGQIIGTVMTPVYDADGTRTPGIDQPLIPQGTKFVGTYEANLTLGSRRLGAGAGELMMPDGTQVMLAESYVMDAAGSMGLGGTVTTSWGQVLLTTAVFAMLDAAQRNAVPDNGYAGQLGSSFATQGSMTAQQIIKQMLGQAVKIRVPAGTILMVSPSKTIRVC